MCPFSCTSCFGSTKLVKEELKYVEILDSSVKPTTIRTLSCRTGQSRCFFKDFQRSYRAFSGIPQTTGGFKMFFQDLCSLDPGNCVMARLMMLWRWALFPWQVATREEDLKRLKFQILGSEGDPSHTKTHRLQNHNIMLGPLPCTTVVLVFSSFPSQRLKHPAEVVSVALPVPNPSILRYESTDFVARSNWSGLKVRNGKGEGLRVLRCVESLFCLVSSSFLSSCP